MTAVDVEALAADLAKAVEIIGENAKADAAAFHDAYRLGFEAGRNVGRMQLDRELVELDRQRAAFVNGLANLPSYAQLEARRWDGRREDFGKPRPGDYAGIPPEVDALYFCPACQQARPYCTCQATRDGQ